MARSLVSLIALVAVAVPAAAQDVAAPQPPPAPPDAADLSKVPDEGPVVTLPEMLALAEKQSWDLAAARERLALADASVRRAWAGVTPDASVAATITRNEFAIEIPLGQERVPFQRLNQLGALFTLSQPLFVMPAFLGIASAKQAAEAVQASVANVKNEVLFAIAQAYYGALAARRVIGLSQSQLAAAQEQERVAKARFDVGQTPKVEYLRAGVARAQAEQDLLRARNQYATAKIALQALVGLDLPFQVAPPPPVQLPSLDADRAVEAALQDRGDLESQRLLAGVARRGVTAAWWQFAPVVNAEGQYRWTNAAGFQGQEWVWLVQITAAWTIYSGERYATLDEARSQLRLAEANRQALERTVVRDVRTAMLDLESARSNLVKAQERQRLARENADIVRAQYAAGAATYLDIIDANNALFAAGVGEITEQSSVEVAALQLRKSIGRFGLEAGAEAAR